MEDFHCSYIGAFWRFLVKKCPGCLFNSVEIYCSVSNNGFSSFWFGMILVGHSFINCLALWNGHNKRLRGQTINETVTNQKRTEPKPLFETGQWLNRQMLMNCDQGVEPVTMCLVCLRLVTPLWIEWIQSIGTGIVNKWWKTLSSQVGCTLNDYRDVGSSPRSASELHL